jgi:hypothetical protein
VLSPSDRKVQNGFPVGEALFSVSSVLLCCIISSVLPSTCQVEYLNRPKASKRFITAVIQSFVL